MRPPNILLILADDLGLCDLGHGTPHLDALAAAASCVVRFRVAPVCAASRAMLLTGRHHLRTGVWGVHGGQDYLDRGEELLPQILVRAGYATGMWGKWHSGHTDGYLPWQRGFEEALMLDLYRHRDPRGRRGGEPVSFPGRWADDVLVDEAIDFIGRHRDRPWFAYLPTMTPHAPLDAPVERVARFRAQGCRERVAVLRAQVEHLDAALGRLLAAVDGMGLAEDTIILFLSDNGPDCLEGDFDDADRAQRDSGALRGWKGDIWENGVRSPLFVRWPGRLHPGVRDGDAGMVDLLPTLCAWAGAAPAGRPLDGRDLGPWLAGAAPAPRRPEFLWTNPAFPPVPERSAAERAVLDEYRPVSVAAMPAAEQVAAVVADGWKLLRRPGTGRGDEATWLVDLGRDPGERENRLDGEPGRAGSLARDLDDWWAGIRAEPAAFRPPVFRIDALVGGEVRACAPVALTGGARNHGLSLDGWDAAGDGARWMLEVVRGGPVRVKLRWRGPVPAPGMQLELACSGVVVRGVVESDGSVRWQEPLMLDAGPATLSLQVVEPGPVRLLLALDGMHLSPVSEGCDGRL